MRTKLLIVFTIKDESTQYLERFANLNEDWDFLEVTLTGNAPVDAIFFINDMGNDHEFTDEPLQVLREVVCNYQNFYIVFHERTKCYKRAVQLKELCSSKVKKYTELHHDNPILTGDLDRIAYAYTKENWSGVKQEVNQLMKRDLWNEPISPLDATLDLLNKLKVPPATQSKTEELWNEILSDKKIHWQEFLEGEPWRYHNNYLDKNYIGSEGLLTKLRNHLL